MRVGQGVPAREVSSLGLLPRLAARVAAQPSLRIVIPAKNEADRIGRTVASFCEYFGERASVLVVANACEDETANVVRELAHRYANLQLLEIAAPIGKGGAVRAGLTIGLEPYLGFVDADGSTRPDQLDVLLAHCQRTQANGAIGSRWLPGSSISRRQPLKRQVASRIFNLLVRIMFGLPYTDTQCGAKVFERGVIDRVFHQLELANFAFDVDLLFALARFGCRIDELPIAWDDVPDFSKVMLLRSGSSMFWALVRLWIRDSVFQHLPWADLVARSSVIPCRSGLRFLILTGDDMVPESAGSLVDEILRQGHEFHHLRIRTVLDIVRYGWYYVTVAHRLYDVIVDCIGQDGSRYSGFSMKPKVHQSTIEALAPAELPLLVERLAERCGYRSFFRRFEHGWALSTARVETLLQESV